jgi:hypothetical protein
MLCRIAASRSLRTVVVAVVGSEGDTIVSRGDLQRSGDVFPTFGVSLVGVNLRGDSPLTDGEPNAPFMLTEFAVFEGMHESAATHIVDVHTDGRKTGALFKHRPVVPGMQTHIVPVGFDYDRLIAPWLPFSGDQETIKILVSVGSYSSHGSRARHRRGRRRTR